MGNLASPLQFAGVASALLWPLAAGVGVVAWSKVRAAAHARKIEAMEGELGEFYRKLEAKPVPPQLAMVVDALQEGEELAAGKATSKPGQKTRAGS
jgi:plasmid stability protein